MGVGGIASRRGVARSWAVWLFDGLALMALLVFAFVAMSAAQRSGTEREARASQHRVTLELIQLRAEWRRIDDVADGPGATAVANAGRPRLVGQIEQARRRIAAAPVGASETLGAGMIDLHTLAASGEPVSSAHPVLDELLEAQLALTTASLAAAEVDELQWGYWALVLLAGMGAWVLARALRWRRRLHVHELRRHAMAALASRIDTAREEERLRLAREVHDALGSTLTALKLDLAGGVELQPGVPPRRQRRAAADLVDQALDCVHRIVCGLRPGALDHEGVWDALQSMVRDFGVRAGLRTSIAMPAALARPASDTAVAIYRIVEEALNNVAKHAEARHVALCIRVQGTALEIEVRDDGRGLESERARRRSDRHGLIGMQERAEAIGGRFELAGRENGGAVARLRLPWPADVPREQPAQDATPHRHAPALGLSALRGWVLGDRAT